MVDVLIACADEEVAIILDIVKAVAEVDWPRNKLRIVILNDQGFETVR